MSVYLETEETGTDALILKETLSKVDDLTDKISSSLHYIAKDSLRAERAIEPVSGKTRQLALYGKNLSATLGVIDEIKDYARTTSECEEIINAGLDRVGLQPYGNALAKLETAHQQLTSSQLKSFFKVVDKTEMLLKKGNSAVKDYLRSFLAKSYTPIDAGALVAKNEIPSRLSEDQRTILRELYAYFKKRNIKVDDIYMDVVPRYFIASTNKLAQTIKHTPQSKKTPIEGLNLYTKSIIDILLALGEDLDGIFSGAQQGQADYYKEELTRIATGEFEKAVDKLTDNMATSKNTDAAAAFELVYRADLVKRVALSLTGKAPSRIMQLSSKLSMAAANVLVEMLKYIETRVQQLAALPSDNGVSDATIDVMSKLSKLADQKDSAIVIMKDTSYGSWIPVPRPGWTTMLPAITPNSNDAREMLACYFSDALDDLFLNLELRAKALGKKSSQIGFLLWMNLTMAEQYAKKCEVANVLGNIGGDRLDRLEKRASKLFSESWNTAAAHLMDVTVVRPGNKQLSSKDRETVKEKFRAFNTEFEELVQRHRAYNITDAALKKRLAKDISFIVPLYHRFYDKHIGGDFSKNVQKYIKYDKDKFDEVIKSLG